VAADFLIFFNLCFIGSVGFDDHLTDSSLASILFASASLGGGCSAGVYHQIVKNMQKKLSSFNVKVSGTHPEIAVTILG
jgi:hypothetical protein